MNSLGLVAQSKEINPIGGDLVEFGSSFESPSFSCDGDWIVYSVRDEQSFRCPTIQLVHVSTGRREDLTFRRHRCETEPAFLANGRIVFTDLRRGTFAVNSNGSYLRRLFRKATQAVTTDGRWFVFRASHTLLLLDAKGRLVRRLTRPLHPRVGRYRSPAFSPDGRWVVYETHIYGQGSDLFVVRRDGAHRRRLTEDGRASQPAFSPNGRWIAFIDHPAAGNVHALALRNPRRVRALTRVPRAAFFTPTWAPR